MPKSSEFDAIYQQLNALSSQELQAIRAKVDVLIADKLSQDEQSLKTVIEYTVIARQRKDLLEEDRLLSASGNEQILDEMKSKSSLEKGDSIERIIELVDEWMSDDSGYDETVLPEIKAGLNQNRLVEK